MSSEHTGRNGYPVAVLAMLVIFGFFLLAVGSGFTLAKNDTHLYAVDNVFCNSPGNSSYTGYCVVPGGTTSMFNDAYNNMAIWGMLFLIGGMAGFVVWYLERE